LFRQIHLEIITSKIAAAPRQQPDPPEKPEVNAGS
jgi:hypothetical protein